MTIQRDQQVLVERGNERFVITYTWSSCRVLGWIGVLITFVPCSLIVATLGKDVWVRYGLEGSAVDGAALYEIILMVILIHGVIEMIARVVNKTMIEVTPGNIRWWHAPLALSIIQHVSLSGSEYIHINENDHVRYHRGPISALETLNASGEQRIVTRCNRKEAAIAIKSEVDLFVALQKSGHVSLKLIQ